MAGISHRAEVSVEASEKHRAGTAMQAGEGHQAGTGAEGSERHKPGADMQAGEKRQSVTGAEGSEKHKIGTVIETGESRRDSENGKYREKLVVLSGRMQMLADMVTAGSRVADVGCDHAFLPVYLVQTGKCPGCLAMDVRKGPLSGAKEHIDSWGLEEYIETRQSDGLSAYHAGEAQTLVCAGMGGRLMEKILTEGGEKSRSFEELILQPQSEIPEFRIFLRNAGYLITEEEAVYEGGKFYFAMKAVYKGWFRPTEQERLEEPERAVKPEFRMRELSKTELPAENGRQTDNELYDLYGKQLLLGKHPVLRQYLQRRMHTVEELIIQLQERDSVKGEARQRELFLEKAHLERALEIYGKGW